MTLTFFGGFTGVVLAILVSQIVMFFVPSLPASVPIWAVFSGLAVSIAVGLVFGVWPARKASRPGSGRGLAIRINQRDTARHAATKMKPRIAQMTQMRLLRQQGL
jgi:predicted lysophospholipase L1 biosynthesis ABC-type transport system permease subunit